MTYELATQTPSTKRYLLKRSICSSYVFLNLCTYRIIYVQHQFTLTLNTILQLTLNIPFVVLSQDILGTEYNFCFTKINQSIYRFYICFTKPLPPHQKLGGNEYIESNQSPLCSIFIFKSNMPPIFNFVPFSFILLYSL